MIIPGKVFVLSSLLACSPNPKKYAEQIAERCELPVESITMGRHREERNWDGVAVEMTATEAHIKLEYVLAPPPGPDAIPNYECVKREWETILIDSKKARNRCGYRFSLQEKTLTFDCLDSDKWSRI